MARNIIRLRVIILIAMYFTRFCNPFSCVTLSALPNFFYAALRAIASAHMFSCALPELSMNRTYYKHLCPFINVLDFRIVILISMRFSRTLNKFFCCKSLRHLYIKLSIFNTNILPFASSNREPQYLYSVVGFTVYCTKIIK